MRAYFTVSTILTHKIPFDLPVTLYCGGSAASLELFLLVQRKVPQKKDPQSALVAKISARLVWDPRQLGPCPTLGSSIFALSLRQGSPGSLAGVGMENPTEKFGDAGRFRTELGSTKAKEFPEGSPKFFRRDFLSEAS